MAGKTTDGTDGSRRHKEPRPGMVACPGCGLEIPEEDRPAQRLHMVTAHLDVILPRLLQMHWDQKLGRRG